MPRYVDTALRPGEKIIYDAKVHWAIFVTPFIRVIFFAIVFGGIWLFTMAGKVFEQAGQSIDKAFPWLPFSLPGGIFLLVLTLTAVGGFIRALIYYFNSDFVVTDRRVIAKFGLLSRTTSEQRLSKVESIHVYQSFLGRMLNFGNITVTGTGSSETKFGPLVDPVAGKHALEEQLDKVRGHED